MAIEYRHIINFSPKRICCPAAQSWSWLVLSWREQGPAAPVPTPAAPARPTPTPVRLPPQTAACSGRTGPASAMTFSLRYSTVLLWCRSTFWVGPKPKCEKGFRIQQPFLSWCFTVIVFFKLIDANLKTWTKLGLEPWQNWKFDTGSWAKLWNWMSGIRVFFF